MLRPLLNVTYSLTVNLAGQEMADKMFTPDPPTADTEGDLRSRRGRKELSPQEREARREFMRSFG